MSLWWGYWEDYPKVTIEGREYAHIGNRLYTKHAVEYFEPSGRRTIGNIPTAPGEGRGFLSEKGRGIPPRFVDETILHGSTHEEIRGNVLRTIYKYGELEVVTEDQGKIVVTISYRHGSQQ